jgi:hypothetical protein
MGRASFWTWDLRWIVRPSDQLRSWTCVEQYDLIRSDMLSEPREGPDGLRQDRSIAIRLTERLYKRRDQPDSDSDSNSHSAHDVDRDVSLD